MAFPSSPTVGQTTVTNNITYVYSVYTATNVGYWTRVYSTATGVRFTNSILPPTTPAPTVGDRWVNTLTMVSYVYSYDGISSYWLDESTPTATFAQTPDIVSPFLLMGA
jgi:hypothetical protein